MIWRSKLDYYSVPCPANRCLNVRLPRHRFQKHHGIIRSPNTLKQKAAVATDFLTQAEQQLQRLRIDEALRLFDLAERAQQDPDSCAAGRWTCHMLSGNFELAWRESDVISSRGNPDPYQYWNGQPLAGHSVLVRCLHGLGDTLQFIRYAPLIRKQARSLAIEAQPRLKSLLQDSQLADHVFTWGEPEPHWDQQMEVVELPRIFRTTLKTIPNHVPYIDVPASCPRQNHRSPRVGLIWASSAYNPARSMPLEQMAPLFDIPDISFFSLQAGPERAELLPWSNRIPSLHQEGACVSADAARLKNTDLLITVDTMMAHLAGAMARPVWTLLPYECDWRWMLDREDSPWYPTMRLFRQPRPGDWPSVIQRVRQALRDFPEQPAPEA